MCVNPNVIGGAESPVWAAAVLCTSTMWSAGCYGSAEFSAALCKSVQNRRWWSAAGDGAGWARVGRQCVLACAGWGGWRREAGQCVDWVDSGTLVTSNIALCPHIAQHWTHSSRDGEGGRRWGTSVMLPPLHQLTTLLFQNPALQATQRVCLLLILNILRRSETRNLWFCALFGDFLCYSASLHSLVNRP